MAKPTSWSAWEYLWPYASRRYTLRTGMTPEQCWEQLKLHVAPEAGRRTTYDVYDNIVGWFHPPGFTIRRADGVIVTPCLTVASGRITRTEAGSRLMVRVALAEVGVIAVSLWLVAWLVFLLVSSATLQPSPSGGPPLGLLWAVWFLGYGMFVLSKRQGREDGVALIRALCEILKAEEETLPIPPGPPPSDPARHGAVKS